MKEPADVKSEAGELGNKFNGFKKRQQNEREKTTINNCSRGFGLSVQIEGPEMYLKTIERLGLYVSTHFKNGSNVKNV